MANPNSVLTKIRFAVSQWLDPHPDKGEAWCVDCTLNDGRTLVLNAAGHRDHIETHRSMVPITSICMRVNFGQVGVPGDENTW